MEKQIYLWGELLFAGSLCYIGLSDICTSNDSPKLKNLFVTAQWITGGSNLSPTQQDLEENQLLLKSIALAEALLIFFAGVLTLLRKHPFGPLLAFAMLALGLA